MLSYTRSVFFLRLLKTEPHQSGISSWAAATHHSILLADEQRKKHARRKVKWMRTGAQETFGGALNCTPRHVEAKGKWRNEEKEKRKKFDQIIKLDLRLRAFAEVNGAWVSRMMREGRRDGFGVFEKLRFARLNRITHSAASSLIKSRVVSIKPSRLPSAMLSRSDFGVVTASRNLCTPPEFVSVLNNFGENVLPHRRREQISPKRH